MALIDQLSPDTQIVYKWNLLKFKFGEGGLKENPAHGIFIAPVLPLLSLFLFLLPV